MFGSIVLIIITLAVIFAPWIAPYGETEPVGDPTETIKFLPPQSAYWFGTDSIGRDMFSLILWGGRVSLFIGVAVAFSAAIIGTLIGAFAGFKGGKFDDFLHAGDGPVPGLPAAGRPAGDPATPPEAGVGPHRVRRHDLDPAHDQPGGRVVDGDGPDRTWTGALVEGEGVHRGWPRPRRHELADHLAAPHPQLHRADHRRHDVHRGRCHHHGMDAVVLRLRRQPPHVSWGNLLAGSKSYIGQGKWWSVVFPSLALLFTVLAINFIGDGLRDAFDPKQAKERV